MTKTINFLDYSLLVLFNTVTSVHLAIIYYYYDNCMIYYITMEHVSTNEQAHVSLIGW